MRNLSSTLSLATILLAAPIPSALAGPLNPPLGPVTSTYKTLVEVEPRTAINATNTPGDANSVFRITQPGSYYLTGNITGASNKHGIEIAASGVTIDLKGFSLSGVTGSLIGITTDGQRDNITIHDGTVKGWGDSGVDLDPAGLNHSQLVERVTAASNGGAGIRTGTNSVIRACMARANATVGLLIEVNGVIADCSAFENGTFGIEGVRNATIVHCTARLNSRIGISADYGAVIDGCSANENGDNGISVYANGTVRGCSAYENGADGINAFLGCSIIASTARGNTGNGISGSGSGMVADCTVSGNTLNGINVGSSNSVRGNTCDANGAGTSIAAGVHATGSNNRIEGNNCTNNDFGFDIDGPGNFLVRNTSANNTQNFVLVADNVFGPILNRTTPASAPVVGNSAPSSLGTTDANANFAY